MSHHHNTRHIRGSIEIFEIAHAEHTPHPREVKLRTIRGMMSGDDYEKFSVDYYSTFSAAKRNEMLDAKIAELTAELPDSFTTPAVTDADEADHEAETYHARYGF